MVTVPMRIGIQNSAYRPTGLVPEAALASAIAASISQILHPRPSLDSYDRLAMADTYAAFCNELVLSDRDPKTVKRYQEVLAACRKWLRDRQPDIESAKEFLADLRQRGYRPSSVLLYYHALRQFFEFVTPCRRSFASSVLLVV